LGFFSLLLGLLGYLPVVTPPPPSFSPPERGHHHEEGDGADDAHETDTGKDQTKHQIPCETLRFDGCEAPLLYCTLSYCNFASKRRSSVYHTLWKLKKNTQKQSQVFPMPLEFAPANLPLPPTN
jgi:hypothetical protein